MTFKMKGFPMQDVSSFKQKKKYPKSYTKKDVEFLEEQNEDIVRYEDLDEKGKAIWRKQGKPVPKTRRKGSMRDLIKKKNTKK